MGAALSLREDYSSDDLKRLARASRDANQTRRLPALSVIYDGGRRSEAVLILDQAGWHTTTKLIVPKNITLLPLPPRSPELNPPSHACKHALPGSGGEHLAIYPR